VTTPPYRLGFAAKIVGGGGLKVTDARRWQSGPHLRHSLELLDVAFTYLDRNDLRMFRLSSSTVPYGTHPDLPQFDYRDQIEACSGELAALGARARAQGLRLSTHPGQYTVINGPDDLLRRKSSLDLEQDTLLLDAMGMGPEAVVVLHVGGVYGDKAGALDRWVRAYEQLSSRARERLAVEHDEQSFDLADVLELHRRTGVKVVFDLHHHRLNVAEAFVDDERAALGAAVATWPEGVRPKVHLSSPRTELRLVQRRRSGERKAQTVAVPPLLDQHADFVPPWDLLGLLRLLDRPCDVMVEAKAKDLAISYLRSGLLRVAPEVAAAEERHVAHAGP
jgi:UV DNA damage endonuclease